LHGGGRSHTIPHPVLQRGGRMVGGERAAKLIQDALGKLLLPEGLAD
jgi:hypothetical protein